MRSRVLLVSTVLLGLLLFACGESQSPDQIWSEARKLSENEEHRAALETYQQILEMEAVSDTLLAKTHFTMADIYLNKRKKFQQALDHYRTVSENYGASRWGPKAQFMIGYVYANHIHDYDKAKTEYQTFLDIYPTHELVEAVNFELNYLGEDLDKIDQLKFLQSAEKPAEQGTGDAN